MNNELFSSLAESLSNTLFGGQDPFQLAIRNAASAFRHVLPKESAKGPRDAFTLCSYISSKMHCRLADPTLHEQHIMRISTTQLFKSIPDLVP